MSKAKRIKEKKRREKRELEIQKQQELEELELEAELEKELANTAETEETPLEPDEEESEEVKKSYFGGEYNEVASVGGPLTFEQIDEMEAAREKAEEIREMTKLIILDKYLRLQVCNKMKYLAENESLSAEVNDLITRKICE